MIELLRSGVGLTLPDDRLESALERHNKPLGDLKYLLERGASQH